MQEGSGALFSFVRLDPGETLRGPGSVGNIRSREGLIQILALSKNHALDIVVVFPYRKYQPGEYCTQSGSDGWDRPTAWENECRGLLDILVKERGRWRDIIIQTEHSCGIDLSAHSLLCPHAICRAIRGTGRVEMSRLENMAVYVLGERCAHDGGGAMEDGEWQAASLRTLEIDGGLGTMSVSVPQVKELTASSDVNGGDAFKVLTSCQATVDTLRWLGTFRHFPAEVRLDRLRTLLIQDCRLQPLPMIQTPALETLIVRSRQVSFPWACIIQLQAVQSLVYLDLWESNIDTNELCLCISGLPNLRDLCFSSWYNQSRARCFESLRSVVAMRKGGENPFRHLVFGCAGRAQFLFSDENEEWGRLVEAALWGKSRVPVGRSAGDRLEACFEGCEHPEGIHLEVL